MANFTPEQIEQFLEEFFTTVGRRQYIGSRYVPIFGRKDETSIEWDNTKPYEPLTIVLYQGDSYTSRTFVPAGIEITDTFYWACTGNYNAQIEQYRQDVIGIRESIDSVSDDVSTLNDTVVEIEGDLGTAQEDITTLQTSLGNTIKYIEKYVTKVFDTVSDMIEDTTLVTNTICKTLGFSSKNDSGGGFYVIDETTDSNPTTYECENNLYAHLIILDTMNADSFGINDTDECSTLLQFALDNCATVILSPHVYIIDSVTIPKNKRLLGTFTRGYELTNCTVIQQNTFSTSPIVVKRGSILSGVKFIQPDLRATAKDSVNIQYAPCIISNSAIDGTLITHVMFMGCYIGIDITNDGSGMLRFDNIYGCCLYRVFKFDKIYDFIAVRDCAFNVPAIIYTSSSFDLEYSFVRYSGGIVEIGKADYPSFENIQVFTARYGIILRKTASGFCRNFTVVNCSFDSVGTGIYSGPTDEYEGLTVTDTIFKTMKGVSSTLTDDVSIGEYAISLYTGNGVNINNCKFTDINASCIYLDNAFDTVITSNVFRNINALNVNDACILRTGATRCIFSDNMINGKSANPSLVNGIDAALVTNNQRMIVAGNFFVNFTNHILFGNSLVGLNRSRILCYGNSSNSNIPQYKSHAIFTKDVTVGTDNIAIANMDDYRQAYHYMTLDFSHAGSVSSQIVCLDRLGGGTMSGYIPVVLGSDYVNFKPHWSDNFIEIAGTSFSNGSHVLCAVSFFELRQEHME